MDVIQQNKSKFEEIRIRMPWGYLAGKWWGSKDVRPILGMHGWQDNAGTFDTLAPLLPPHISLLSLDLPGHGLSSRMPDGLPYNFSDYLKIIRMIMKKYNWDKISLLGHSMSAKICFMYAAIFPEQVDMVIGIDALKPHIKPAGEMISMLTYVIQNFSVADKRNREKTEPPSYTYDELITRVYEGTGGSVSKESCKYLLARNIAKSTMYPDKYFFTRDSRLKIQNYGTIFQELNLEMAKRIKAPYLFIKATNSTFYERKRYYDETIVILKNNPKFELYNIDGTHHVHLNEPEKISGIINNFINKYRASEGKCKL